MRTNLSTTMLRLLQIAILSGGLMSINLVMAEKYEPEGIRSGSIIYYPYVNIFGVSYDDNIFSEETDAQGSRITNIGAGMLMQIAQENTKGMFDVGVEVQKGIYHSSRDDDYTDSGLTAGYTYQPNDKFRLKAEAGIKQLHDARTPLTLPTSPSPDRYQDTAVDGEWYYGINNWEGADSLIAVNLTKRTYKSNLAVNEAKDHQQASISGLLRFPLRSAPNSRFRVSARYRNFDYDISDNQDSNQLRAMIGIEWQASEQMLLSADLGGQNKKFAQNSSVDDSDIAWEIGLTWAPEDYNKLELTASNDFAESKTTASHLTKRKIDMVWSYDWEDYLTTLLAAGSSRDTSIDGVSTTVDTTNHISLSFEYGLLQTVMLNGGISRINVDSQIPGNSSVKNIFNFGVTAGF